MQHKKIGIKYCGGCNPTYDRVEMIQRIESKHKNQFLFVRYDEPKIDAIVFVNGCFRACAIQDFHFLEISFYSVSKESDFKNLIGYLLSRS